MATQVPLVAQKRLKKDYMEIIKEPVPFIVAHPLENNILEWHFVLKGPPDTPYEGGCYHGKLNFPKEFPYKPPAIRMLTPSGRFQVNQRICLSMSDFHPETWSPLWTVSAVLNGFLSFMLSEDMASGALSGTGSDIENRKRLAKQSWKYNLKDPIFCKIFPDLAEEAKK